MPNIKPILFTALLILLGAASQVVAGSVDARLSAREAYVGTPITLQITITDANDYGQPKLPEVSGCDIRSVGAPSKSSQVTIINGRRSESRSVTMQYQITPRREGTFDIPSMSVKVDGKNVATRPMRFAATKSVTGDLLFVEIEGGKEKVFVGQPIDLTLKIWIKPYRDRERNMTLSEGDMWKMISDQTSWGGFTERLHELAENNQRPGGEEVLRDDGQGNERSYYLYKIEATVYPKRPGQIDADDVQIVVNYPTAIGKSRSPFGSLFEDSSFARDPFGSNPLGGSSPLSRMMNDDFFGSSFGNRLVVTSTRPVVGEVQVDATKVVPVPSQGRPADYRGAVGRYRIVTRATPTVVDAGDPITLTIGIAGDGPMELLQAPPLADLPSLTADFKVEDQSLAGFVRDETKVFSTTIRPRKEGLTEIPAILFSFFDPETETFQTVRSDPISITVHKSETLALDAIVGKAGTDKDRSTASAAPATNHLPDFTNNDSSDILLSQSPPTTFQWWWACVVLPPLLWLATIAGKNRNAIRRRLPSFGPAHGRCLVSIRRASDAASIADALADYIAARSGKPCSSTVGAIGALRTSGMYAVASEVESHMLGAERVDFASASSQELQQYRQRALELLEKLEASFKSTKKSRVRATKAIAKELPAPRVARHSVVLMLATAVAFWASHGVASEPAARSEAAVASVRLTLAQQETILKEAQQVYSQASDLASTDSAEAKQFFEAAAEKYQLLVDSGVRNSELYLNLGNAYLQGGELGRAIANYERARQLDPSNRTLLVNLKFAGTQVKGGTPAAAAGQLTSWSVPMQRVRFANELLIQSSGISAVVVCLAISSLLFWGLLIVRAAGYPFHTWRLAAVPLLMFIVSLGSLTLASTETRSRGNGVIVADDVKLYAGDGEQFDTVATLDEAQGCGVEILATRDQWTRIRTAHGHTGWVPEKDVERIRS